MESVNNIAIIDDLPSDANRIKKLLNELFEDYEFFVFDNIHDCMNCHKHFKLCSIDIYLNDDNILDYLNKELIDSDFIIYFSNVNDQMQKAFGKNVLGYFVKSDSDDALNKQLSEKLNPYLKRQFSFRSSKGVVSLPVNSFYKVSIERRRLFLYTSDNKIRMFDMTLAGCMDCLKEDALQIDKSIIVNINHIMNIQGDTIFFDNGTLERISYRRIKDVNLKFIRRLLK